VLRAAHEFLLARSLVPMLDATPAGQMVYRTNNYLDVAPICRWVGKGTANTVAATGPARLSQLAEVDATAFGADRLQVLGAVLARKGSRLLSQDGGYVIIRNGRTAYHVGPIVAPSARVAAALLGNAMRSVAGRTIIDLREDAAPLLDLGNFGFTRARPFVRMAYGRTGEYGRPEQVFAIGGPDLG
jgi:hypothetical protein